MKYNPISNSLDETFFGYYDTTMVSEGRWIYHAISENVCKILLNDFAVSKEIILDETMAYNFQQGSRLQWLNQNQIIYNSFDDGNVISKIYDISTRSFKMAPPIASRASDSEFWTINYDLLTQYEPEYGYNKISRSFSKAPELKLIRLSEDGQWSVERNPNFSQYTTDLKQCFVNHVLTNNSSTHTVFLIRGIKNKSRINRLMHYDHNSDEIHLLHEHDYISHYNFKSQTEIIIFMSIKGRRNYFFFDILSKEIKKININFPDRDGHPTIGKLYAVTDTYPSITGYQELVVVNHATGQICAQKLQHAPKYTRENRCDLHPRLHGNMILFDTVDSGKRQAVYSVVK